MNSTTTTFFTTNTTSTVDKAVDPKRDSVRISLEEFEELMEYKRLCKSIFEMFRELLELEKEAEE